MKYALLILLLCSTTFAKQRDWQDAVVVKSGSSNNGAAAVPVGSIMVAVPLSRNVYKVETNELIIVVSTERNLDITLNKKTKLALDKKNAWIIDDEGKERKVYVVSKEAKPTPTPAPQAAR